MSTTESEILALSQVSVIHTISALLFFITISRSSILFTRDLVFERNREGKETFVVDGVCILRQGIWIKLLDIRRVVNLDVVIVESLEGVTFLEQTRGTPASRFARVWADFEKNMVGKLVGQTYHYDA